MIIRARPKYFSLAKNQSAGLRNDNELFLSSGRSSLKFLVEQFSSFYKVKPTILVQSFNCQVVLDACLEAGANVILMDIKLSDFSISYEDIVNLKYLPDMVLVTHYQGIPNSEYVKIAEYCKKKGIFLIEDLAQTYHSKINNVRVGTLGNVALHSFAIDKPFSCFEGGGLELLNISVGFKQKLSNEYANLPFESKFKTETDLAKLELFNSITCNAEFFKSFRSFKSVGFLVEQGLSVAFIKYFIGLRVVFSLFEKIYGVLSSFKRAGRIPLLKLCDEKVAEVSRQRACYEYEGREVENLERYLLEFGFEPNHYLGSDVHWNRYSFIEETGLLIELLNSSGIEAGRFNWPTPLHKNKPQSHSVTWTGKLENSEYASKNIVNIPIWSNFFQNFSTEA